MEADGLRMEYSTRKQYISICEAAFILYFTVQFDTVSYTMYKYTRQREEETVCPILYSPRTFGVLFCMCVLP